MVERVEYSNGKILENLFDPYRNKNVEITFNDEVVVISGENRIINKKFEFVSKYKKSECSDASRKSYALDDVLLQYRNSDVFREGMTGEQWSDAR